MKFTPDSDLPTVADNVQLVNLTAADGTPVALSVRAVRRPVSATEISASHGTYSIDDVKWHLVAEDLLDPPAVGQHIVEAGGAAWEIHAVAQQVYGTRWRCVSRRV